MNMQDLLKEYKELETTVKKLSDRKKEIAEQIMPVLIEGPINTDDYSAVLVISSSERIAAKEHLIKAIGEEILRKYGLFKEVESKSIKVQEKKKA